ncbi:MAG: metallophosphoesterase [Dictyoglomi bacterium]|nr:metallophosphoesterase [Dictyoglomota bacterium]
MLKTLKKKILGIPSIPEHAKGGILHISDTPRPIYRWLKYLINTVQPSYIIHTGDIADDIKLENAPMRLRNIYREAVREFRNILSDYLESTYIVVGNHDDKEILSSILSLAHIVNEPYKVILNDISFLLAHKPPTCPEDVDFILFGHQPTENLLELSRCLNGIHNIHIISKDKQVFYVPYPKGTNKYRKLRWGDGSDFIHRGP